MEDKTKSILFGTKQRLKCDLQVEIIRGEFNVKQHAEVKYLEYIFHSNLSAGEEVAVKLLNKVNSRQTLLYLLTNKMIIFCEIIFFR